jgi:hypothetical protein
MPRSLFPVLAFLAMPALAEAPNLSATPQEKTGSAAQLVLAQQTYLDAVISGEVRELLTAIRLARAVTLRPALGWEKTLAGEQQSDAPMGVAGPPDPAGAAALSIARNLAGDDPDLQDLVWDLDAQLPGPNTPTVVEVRGNLYPGQTDEWRLPLFGEVAAEIGLIGDGDGPLQMTVLDAGGATVCTHPASAQPALCHLTPARNGFFTVSILNSGTMVNSYRLVGN